jgi:hypothetical protein
MLNDEQVGFFKTNGYLILSGAMVVEQCKKVRELMWSALPEQSLLQPDDPASHIGPFKTVDESTDARHLRQGYRWLNRFLGVNPEVINLIYSESICGMAQQLLGGQLRQAVANGVPMGSFGNAWPGGPTDPAAGNEGARGVYCTLPYGNKAKEADQCHTDGHPFALGVVGLIDDCPEDGGGFKIWPASHKRLYPTFALRYDQLRIPYYNHLPSYKGIVHSPEYLREIDFLNRDVASVECWGRAGDIVFWHHRLAHMAGHNYTNTIRQAVLADFWTTDLDRLRTVSAQGDMWGDWSQQVQSSDGQYSAPFARIQRLPS